MSNFISTARPDCLAIRVPDPFECLPSRARRVSGPFHIHPFSKSIATELPQHQVLSGWTVASVSSVDPESKVTFHRRQVSFQYLSAKTGEFQSGESPWELAAAKEMEADPTKVSYRCQGAKCLIATPDGTKSYGPDIVDCDGDGNVTLTEIKASSSYFVEPAYASLMAVVERDLPKFDIRFVKKTGDELMHASQRRRRYNVNRVFDDRFTPFDERHLDVVANRFAADGPEVPLGRIGAAMGLDPTAALEVINALMCARHLAYDLDVFVGPDTPLRALLPAKKSRHDIRALGR